MDDKTFKSYEERILDSIDVHNPQSTNTLIRFFNILNNLIKYLSNTEFSTLGYTQEIERQFEFFSSEDDYLNNFRQLLDTRTKADSIRVAKVFYYLVMPHAFDGSRSDTNILTAECMKRISKLYD